MMRSLMIDSERGHRYLYRPVELHVAGTNGLIDALIALAREKCPEYPFDAPDLEIAYMERDHTGLIMFELSWSRLHGLRCEYKPTTAPMTTKPKLTTPIGALAPKSFSDLRVYIAGVYHNRIDADTVRIMSRDMTIVTELQEVNLLRAQSVIPLEPLSVFEFVRLVIAGVEKFIPVRNPKETESPEARMFSDVVPGARNYVFIMGESPEPQHNPEPMKPDPVLFPPAPTMYECRRAAARLWCDPVFAKCVMNPALCELIARAMHAECYKPPGDEPKPDGAKCPTTP